MRADLDIKESIVIDDDTSDTFYPDAVSRELSYPFAIENPDGNIEVAYTYHRSEIRVATIKC